MYSLDGSFIAIRNLTDEILVRTIYVVNTYYTCTGATPCYTPGADATPCYTSGATPCYTPGATPCYTTGATPCYTHTGVPLQLCKDLPSRTSSAWTVGTIYGIEVQSTGVNKGLLTFDLSF